LDGFFSTPWVMLEEETLIYAHYDVTPSYNVLIGQWFKEFKTLD
jgi:hypothetical protein